MDRGIMTRFRIAGTAVGVLVGVALLTGFSPAATPAPPVQVVKVEILQDAMRIIQGPDGKYHDAFVPYSFILRAGTPVRFVIKNYDDGPHTLTAPDLGLNIQIKPGLDLPNGNVAPVTTTYTFTPTKKGTFRWFCSYACDSWAMEPGFAGPSREGYMAGYIDTL